MKAAIAEIPLVRFDFICRLTISKFNFILVTTDSQTSEEDLLPPPLPAKHRDSDYGNIPEDSQYSSVKSIRGSDGYQFTDRPLPSTPGDSVSNSHYEVLEVKNREVIMTVVKKNPPTPPPKPARTSKGSYSP